MDAALIIAFVWLGLLTAGFIYMAFNFDKAREDFKALRNAATGLSDGVSNELREMQESLSELRDSAAGAAGSAYDELQERIDAIQDDLESSDIVARLNKHGSGIRQLQEQVANLVAEPTLHKLEPRVVTSTPDSIQIGTSPVSIEKRESGAIIATTDPAATPDIPDDGPDDLDTAEIK